MHPDAEPIIQPLLDALTTDEPDQSPGVWEGASTGLGGAIAWWLYSEWLRQHPPSPPVPELPPSIQPRMLGGAMLILATVILQRLDEIHTDWERQLEWSPADQPTTKPQEITQLVRGVIDIIIYENDATPQRAYAYAIRPKKRRDGDGKRVRILAYSRAQ